MRFLPLVLLFSACFPPLLPDAEGPDALVSRKHAHNDYEHKHPLYDALDAHFESVEADIWLRERDLGVSHLGLAFKGSLRELYLDPLAARIAANGGSVYGDGKPFYLWIEFKDGRQRVQDLLAAQLAQYSFFTTFDDYGVAQQGAVTVVLTAGSDVVKRAMVNRPAPRPYTRDSFYAPGDPPADGKWGYYGMPYSRFLKWNGHGTIPEAERKQLENLVNGAHALGRPIRIWANPDTPEYWNAAREAHVDFVNADDLKGLSSTFPLPLNAQLLQ